MRTPCKDIIMQKQGDESQEQAKQGVNFLAPISFFEPFPYQRQQLLANTTIFILNNKCYPQQKKLSTTTTVIHNNDCYPQQQLLFKNIATGETSQAITLFTSLTILTSLAFITRYHRKLLQICLHHHQKFLKRCLHYHQKLI